MSGVKSAKTGTTEEVHGISSAVDFGPEDTPQVIAGYGETAKIEGAKTKEVRNVSELVDCRMAMENVMLTSHQAELYAAIEETNIQRWSKTSIHLYCE